MILVFVVLWYILNHTPWGRHVYAIGDDKEAAELTGIRTDRTLVSVYALAGLVCAIGAWAAIGRVGSVSPQSFYEGNLQSITAVVIGGISLFGGRGSIMGPFIGALIVGVFESGLQPRRRRRALAGLRRRLADHHRRCHRPMDQEDLIMSAASTGSTQQPVLQGKGLVKRYGRVTALDHADFELMPNEILAVIGDNGAGKSSMIKAVSGAVVPDEGEILLDGQPVSFRSPLEAREAGIETVYQTLALVAGADYRGQHVPRPRDRAGRPARQMVQDDRQESHGRSRPRKMLSELGLATIQNIDQAVETLSGGQRQGVAVARAAAFGSKVVIMDEPTAALGVKESRRVLELILDVKARGLPIVLISHNMPHVFEVADRIHIHRLGKRLCVIDPKDFTMSDAVALMTGAKEPPPELLH